MTRSLETNIGKEIDEGARPKPQQQGNLFGVCIKSEAVRKGRSANGRLFRFSSKSRWRRKKEHLFEAGLASGLKAWAKRHMGERGGSLRNGVKKHSIWEERDTHGKWKTITGKRVAERLTDLGKSGV